MAIESLPDPVEGMREATTEEVMNWLNGYVNSDRYIETSNGLMVME